MASLSAFVAASMVPGGEIDCAHLVAKRIRTEPADSLVNNAGLGRDKC
jgi:hypothetical protein